MALDVRKFGPKSDKIGAHRGAFVYQEPFKKDSSTASRVINEVVLERLYEKPSKASQTPHDEATHGSIYQRFAACTQPLVVFAHPPVPSRKVVRKQAPL